MKKMLIPFGTVLALSAMVATATPRYWYPNADMVQFTGPGNAVAVSSHPLNDPSGWVTYYYATYGARNASAAMLGLPGEVAVDNAASAYARDADTGIWVPMQILVGTSETFPSQ